jgi:thiamine biosynthesis lipoprotein
MQNRLTYSFLCTMKYWLIILALVVTSCNTAVQTNDYKTIKGNAQGTTYTIVFQDTIARNLQPAIDSILHHYDGALSNYTATSTLQLFNTADTKVTVRDTFGYFTDVLFQSITLHEKTKGAFNPAIWPLVQAWGFGTDKVVQAPKNTDSLLSLIDINSNTFELKNDSLGLVLTYYKKANQRFDFNAIAQGHSVDVIHDFLMSISITNHMVEIGGEVRVLGINQGGDLWKLGIDKPLENAEGRPLKAIIQLDNQAIATSGNYRKFKMLNGKKVTHTINPETGKPAYHNLLSATVVAKTAAEADGLATAFMVMGGEKTKQFILDNPELSIGVYLIISSDMGMITYTSPSIVSQIQELD